ncbi:MAG: 16S rRNA (cytosine(1402)-N(4))-methyltransferase RsmH [Candidatus Eisenbacteria bacterium]|nr:16S rRNA (cytosine(1402)-N(4))-methyltransferase RsmH [Candidatus Eisenbacteria bacterium]
MSARHEPVLVAEVLQFLRNGPGLYLDATLGDGGHAEALLESESGARLLGADRDPAALDFARERLARFGDRVTLAHATFRELPAAHARIGGEPFTGALLDLGLSSRQIDDARRGMSFMSEGPLDLRMDPSRGESAADRLREITEEQLAWVLETHGDVRGARRLARVLVAEARSGALLTTRDLVATIERALPGRPHPRRLAQVFQALRIWINGEAEDLESVLSWLPSAITAGGIVVTLAYHSGEDRRIKHSLRGRAPSVNPRRLPPTAEPRLPEGPWFELTRKVVTPGHDEEVRNPRARSAKLRAFRRKPA